MKRAITLVLLPVIAALLAGCGGSSSSTSTPASAAPPAPSTSTPAPTSAAPSPTTAALVTTKPNKLGTVLAAGPKKLTVYLFEADTAGASTCRGACAKVWPPVRTSGQPRASGQAVASQLGTVKRSDGTVQVTYKGHPLYLFAKDGDAGDAYGQGSKLFGASWYVLAPSGQKIDKS